MWNVFIGSAVELIINKEGYGVYSSNMQSVEVRISSLLLMLEIQSFIGLRDGLGKEETCSVVVISHTSQLSLQADKVPFIGKETFA